MTIVPIEAGNLILLTKGDFMVREIPIGMVESIDSISEPEKRLLGDKDDNRKLVLSYSDGASHSLTIDVDDGKADEIVKEINTLKDIEADYFKASEFEYREGDRWIRSRFLCPDAVPCAGRNGSLEGGRHSRLYLQAVQVGQGRHQHPSAVLRV